MNDLLDASDAPVLSPLEYRRFCELAYERCGLNIHSGKEHLVTARLLRVMRSTGMTSFDEYYRSVIADATGKALEGLINALTTNHTSFFREPAHFEFFATRILPNLVNRSEINVWSAACSTGEEPYSIVFSIAEALGDAALLRTQLLATDISTKVLARAEKGLFESERVGSLSTAQLRRFFLKGNESCANWFMAKKEVRNCIRFRRLNLMENLQSVGIFPLIFCRNVMIYFDSQTQEKVVRSLAQCLEPGGYLFIGHSESLGAIAHDLQFIAPAIYRKPGINKRGLS